MSVLGRTVEEVGRKLDSMLQEAREARASLERSWRRNERYLRSKYPKPNRAHRSDLYSNYIYRVVLHYTTLLTDARPHFNVSVRGRGKWAVSLQKALQAVLARWWFENEIDRLLMLSVPYLFTHGKIYWKVVWDPAVGEPCVIPVSPWDVFVDPNARTLADADWICQRSVVSRWELLRRYPEEVLEGVKWRKDLSSFPVSVSEKDVSRYGFSIGPNEFAVLPDVWSGERVPVAMSPSAVEKTEYEEWLIRDPARLENGAPAYPVCRVIIRAGGKIIADGNYPYWDRWPGWWVEAFANAAGVNVYGHPEVDQWVSVQEGLNVSLRLSLIHI